jgi:hypothetical protein
MFNFNKNRVGLPFGRFFSQTHLFTLVGTTTALLLCVVEEKTIVLLANAKPL